ncbi:hypothetical protein [Streptomyces sp. NPDC054794]
MGTALILALADSPAVEVIELGGRLRYSKKAFLGSAAWQQLPSITPNVGFLAADRLVAGRGLGRRRWSRRD